MPDDDKQPNPNLTGKRKPRGVADSADPKSVKPSAAGGSNSKQQRTRKQSPKPARNSADPFFKAKLTEMALEAGLDKGPTELQIPRSSLSDMFLIVPKGMLLQNPLLRYLREFNIIEFKGQGDHFNAQTFEVQLARVYLWHSQNHQRASYDRILNVIVSARYPTNVFDFSAERGSPFTKVNNQDWLWQARVGWQDVVVVVCQNLPIAKPFYPWLAFAPGKSLAWNRFVRAVVADQDWNLLSWLAQARPEELFEEIFMNTELEQELAENYPAEWERLQAEYGRVARQWFATKAKTNMPAVREMLAELPVEDRLAGLKPEDRLAGLTPEEIQTLLKKYAPQGG